MVQNISIAICFIKLVLQFSQSFSLFDFRFKLDFEKPMGLFTLGHSCIFTEQIAIHFVKTVHFTLGKINASLQNEFMWCM